MRKNEQWVNPYNKLHNVLSPFTFTIEGFPFAHKLTESEVIGCMRLLKISDEREQFVLMDKEEPKEITDILYNLKKR